MPASRLGEFLCSERLLGAIALLVELGYRRLVVRHRASPNPAGLAPEVGLEPTTNRLTADRSTTELLRIEKEKII